MNESQAKDQSLTSEQIKERGIINAAATQLADIIYQWVWYREKHLAPERHRKLTCQEDNS